MAAERIDRVESQVDSINSELISFGKTLGEIKGLWRKSGGRTG